MSNDATTQLLESLNNESLPCQWQGCQQSFPTAEDLYTHLTENHIGRKSTGNLNLQCKWGSCSVATVKRDHITSHVRVHVPLKPHTCNICSKSFKRPQDLKKHIKTHADDSVIVPSPIADHRRGGPGGPGGYPGPDGMYQGGGPDSTATNYSYAATGHNGDGYQGHHPSAGGYYGQTQHNSHYGPVYYPVSHGPHGAVLNDARRRGYDELNDFFGDIKNQRVAPVYSHEITQRLAGLHHILPVIQGGTHIDYQSPAGYPQYQLPHIPSLRTKTELLDGENFLNALSSTLLESPNAAAAAGVHHPGVHYAPAQLNFRSSHSPPQYPSHSPPHRLSPGAHMSSAPMMHTQSSSSHGTALLTPPPPSHAVMQATTGAAYPNLAALASGDVSATYTSTAGSAPMSTVSSAFDRNQGRRLAENLLQSARKDSEEVEHSDEAPSPQSRSTPGASDRLAEGLKSVDISSAVIDPQLGGTAGKEKAKDESRKNSESRSEGADEWIEALRVVEALKEYVSRKLANKEYDEGSASPAARQSPKEDDTEMTELEQDRVNLYPILKAVQDE